MKIQFDAMEEKVVPQFRGGEKETRLRMIVDEKNKIMRGVLAPGATIGLHTHDTNCEVVYIVEGVGTMLYDGEIEMLYAGDCHYCPKGHQHSLMNKSEQDLVFFAVVPEQ